MAASFAVSRCPFLHEVAAREGHEYAANLAVDPTRPAAARVRKDGGVDDASSSSSLMATFRLYHGEHGVVPLVGFEARERNLAMQASGCPFHRMRQEAEQREAEKKKQQQQSTVVLPPPAAPPAHALAPPLASMSMSFGPGVREMTTLSR